jgi:hypothetical protein
MSDNSGAHPYQKLFERGQAIRLFPESADIFTKMRSSFFFELLRITFSQGLELELRDAFAGDDSTILVPYAAVEMMVGASPGEDDFQTLLKRDRKTIKDDPSHTEFVPLTFREFGNAFHELSAVGKVPQLIELFGPDDPPIWVSSVYANRFKRFVLEHGLYEVDNRFRMLLQSQTCQCRGKS